MTDLSGLSAQIQTFLQNSNTSDSGNSESDIQFGSALKESFLDEKKETILERLAFFREVLEKAKEDGKIDEEKYLEFVALLNRREERVNLIGSPQGKEQLIVLKGMIEKLQSALLTSGADETGLSTIDTAFFPGFLGAESLTLFDQLDQANLASLLSTNEKALYEEHANDRQLMTELFEVLLS